MGDQAARGTSLETDWLLPLPHPASSTPSLFSPGSYPLTNHWHLSHHPECASETIQPNTPPDYLAHVFLLPICEISLLSPVKNVRYTQRNMLNINDNCKSHERILIDQI